MRIRQSLLPLAVLTVCGAGGALYARQSEAPVPTNAVSVELRPTDAEFANPERGFYRPLKTDLARLAADDVKDAFADGYRLMYARIDLEPYARTELPAELLDRLDTAFAVARRGGVKLIVRGTYNYPRGETGYQSAQDAPLPRVLGHLAQLKPVWRRNADVIAFVQAGFIGAWGEWHASSNGLTEPVARTRIKDALLDAVPASRFVQFRYPPYLADWAPTLPGVAATLSGGFRLGFHNDCFLASQTDVGTYDDDPAKRQAQQVYLDSLGDVAPFGGETCNPADDPGATPRVGCDAILDEGGRYNLTYLNTSYYRKLFHERWIAEGCMAEVRRRMGYRIALIGASHPATAARGGRVDVAIVARNAGWARIYNPRLVAVLLRHRGTGLVRRLRADGADPRGWLPGVDTAATLRIALPGDLAAGAYEVLFALPDADLRLAGDARYAIRVANADDPAKGQRWDDGLGAFGLGTVLTIE